MNISTYERQIMEFVYLGLSGEEIAEKAGVTHSTVKFHLSRIYKKVGVSSRAKLMRLMFDQEIQKLKAQINILKTLRGEA